MLWSARLQCLLSYWSVNTVYSYMSTSFYRIIPEKALSCFRVLRFYHFSAWANLQLIVKAYLRLCNRLSLFWQYLIWFFSLTYFLLFCNDLLNDFRVLFTCLRLRTITVKLLKEKLFARSLSDRFGVILRRYSGTILKIIAWYNWRLCDRNLFF